MPEGLDLGVSGLASNFDWRSLVDQLIAVERAPQRRLQTEQQTIQDRQAAYDSIATQLGALQNRAAALSDSGLFDARQVATSNATVAKATVTAGAALGSYAFHIIQRATSAVRPGAANISGALCPTTDVSTVLLSSAAFVAPVTAGTFTVNGQQITIEPTDTLQVVFQKINAATNREVVASYDPSTDRINLTSSTGEIVLGSATDASNFLQIARLFNNGTDAISSASALGSVRLASTLSAANLLTPIDDGGSGAGKFKINSVEIDYNASTDSISDLLKRINASAAGVTASYDSANDRFLLTSKATGDIGIALEEVPGAGNFLSATGLLGSTLQRGHDLLYTVNDGAQLSSHSNTITEDASGIAGLSVTVLDAGDVRVETTSDADKIKTAITDFINDYNRLQSLIDTNTASSTDAKGHVTAGTLAGESDAYDIASQLRRLVGATFSSLTGTIKRLESLGITTNGDNNNLTLADSAKLDAALADNLSEVKLLFTNTTDGLASKLNDYLEKTVGTDGTLTSKQDRLGKQISGIDDQIAEQERQVQTNRQQLFDSFLAMEQAQLQINQQLQFLAQRFGSSSS